MADTQERIDLRQASRLVLAHRAGISSSEAWRTIARICAAEGPSIAAAQTEDGKPLQLTPQHWRRAVKPTPQLMDGSTMRIAGNDGYIDAVGQIRVGNDRQWTAYQNERKGFQAFEVKIDAPAFEAALHKLYPVQHTPKPTQRLLRKHGSPIDGIWRVVIEDLGKRGYTAPDKGAVAAFIRGVLARAIGADVAQHTFKDWDNRLRPCFGDLRHVTDNPNAADPLPSISNGKHQQSSQKDLLYHALIVLRARKGRTLSQNKEAELLQELRQVAQLRSWPFDPDHWEAVISECSS